MSSTEVRFSVGVDNLDSVKQLKKDFEDLQDAYEGLDQAYDDLNRKNKGLQHTIEQLREELNRTAMSAATVFEKWVKGATGLGNTVKFTEEFRKNFGSIQDELNNGVITLDQAKAKAAAMSEEIAAVYNIEQANIKATVDAQAELASAMNTTTNSTQGVAQSVEAVIQTENQLSEASESAATSVQTANEAIAGSPPPPPNLTELVEVLKLLTSSVHEVAAALPEVNQAEENADKTVRKIAVGTDEYNKVLVTCENRVAKLSKELVSYSAAQNDPATSNAYAKIKDLTTAYSELEEQAVSNEWTYSEFLKKVRELDAEHAKARTLIIQNGKAYEDLGTKVSRVAKLTSQFFSSSRLISIGLQKIKELWNYSLKIEDSMTQLKIVTEATDGQMTEFLSESVSLAKELGSSIEDVLSSIETFSRLGYSLDESSILSKYAGILSNVADTSAEDATTGLTSIIKGYQMDVDNAEHVSDVLIEVGQKYAVSASELIEAYEKSGAALSATNTSFEKSAGLIAAAQAAVDFCRAA